MFCPNGSNQKTNLKMPIPTNKHLFSSGNAGKNGFIRSSASKKCDSIGWKDENEEFHQNQMSDFFTNTILGSQQIFGVPGQRNNKAAFPMNNILNSI